MRRSSSPKRERKNPFHKRTMLRCERLEDRSLMSCNVISGFVYYDINNDGLYQPQTESPIANSTIQLRNASNVVVGITTTDANGSYAFDADLSKPDRAVSLTKTVTFPTTQTNFNLQRSLEQFNPNLGALESIEITHAGSITSEIKVENVSTASGSTITGTVSGNMTLTAPGVSNTLGISGQAGSFQAQIYDGLTDFGGTSGASFGQKTAGGTSTITLSGSAINAYIGTGTVVINEVAVATSDAAGGGNIDTQIRSTATSTITVVYHYKVPECLDPGDYKIIQTAQPATFFDGKESRDGTVIPNTIGTDFINVTLDDTDLENNDFGELKSARLSGHVWYDENDDGIRQNTEALIPGTIITLQTAAGPPLQTMTDANGFYEFTGLDPGTYTIKETQPANYLDGFDNAGTEGGTVVDDPAEDQIRNIILAAGDNSQDNDFGEILPASLAGYVYYDANNNGLFETSESAIASVTVELAGFDDHGPVSLTTTTNAAGKYEFTNLRPGTYAISETQPAGYDDGQDTIGTQGGTTDNDVFSAIELAAGVNGVNNNFGEIRPDRPDDPLPRNVLPFGTLPVYTKAQLTAIPIPVSAMNPAIREYLALLVGTSVTLTNHQPTTAEAVAAVQQIQNAPTQSELVEQLWNSDAHRAIQAESLYQSVFDRAPSDAEKAGTIQTLRNGVSELEIKEQLFVSLDYQQLHPTTLNLAEALYADILNVIPGTQSTQSLLQSMDNATLQDVVHDLLTSDASLANLIDAAYHLTLRRAATATEISTWKTPIKNGTITLDDLAQRLLNSQEFYELVLANVR